MCLLVRAITEFHFYPAFHDYGALNAVNIIIYTILFIALLYLAFIHLWVLVRSRRKIREFSSELKVLKEQREDLQLKNKDLTDSLTYARRIQSALLPADHHVRRIIPDHFILYKPKHIVSGDFYWVSQRNGKMFIAAADCTGHGVPGALMSMIGLELLQKIINEMKIDESDEILRALNKELESAFYKEEDGRALIKDGIEMSLCVINRETRELEFSGAFLPVYIIRDDNLIEIKGDKINVGQTFEDVTFNKNRHSLREGDLIYLFSDGYADQFGGPDNKKFMYRRLRHILLTISKYPLDDQKRILDETITSWMRDTEQIDDMMILGFRAS